MYNNLHPTVVRPWTTWVVPAAKNMRFTSNCLVQFLSAVFLKLYSLVPVSHYSAPKVSSWCKRISKSSLLIRKSCVPPLNYDTYSLELNVDNAVPFANLHHHFNKRICLSIRYICHKPTWQIKNFYYQGCHKYLSDGKITLGSSVDGNTPSRAW